MSLLLYCFALRQLPNARLIVLYIHFVVDELDEISIKDVAELVVEAMDLKNGISVSFQYVGSHVLFLMPSWKRSEICRCGIGYRFHPLKMNICSNTFSFCNELKNIQTHSLDLSYESTRLKTAHIGTL